MAPHSFLPLFAVWKLGGEGWNTGCWAHREKIEKLQSQCLPHFTSLEELLQGGKYAADLWDQRNGGNLVTGRFLRWLKISHALYMRHPPLATRCVMPLFLALSKVPYCPLSLTYLGCLSLDKAVNKLSSSLWPLICVGVFIVLVQWSTPVLSLSITLPKFSNSQCSWRELSVHKVNSAYQVLFSPPPHKSLGTRLAIPQICATWPGVIRFELNGEMENASFVRGSLWASDVTMPLSEVLRERRYRHVGHGAKR